MKLSLTTLRQSALVAVVALALSACGGGGGGGSGSSPSAASNDGDLGEGLLFISGTVSAAINTATDSDTRDPSQQLSNNRMSEAQSLPNPITVGGHVSYSADRGNGCSSISDSEDHADYFSIELFEEQNIELIIADRDFADLDLFLLDSDGVVRGSSRSANSHERISVPADGEYFLLICAYRGGSNYQLAVGHNFANGSRLFGHSTAESFVSGEALVRWQNPAAKQNQLNGATMAQTDEQVSLFRMPPSLIWQYSRSRLFSFDQIDAARDYATVNFIKSLNQHEAVAFAEPNALLKPQLVPNDPGYDVQWHYPLINLPEAWDISTGSSDVLVAVVDTGVLLDHPDLQGQFDPNDPNGYDFISSADNAGDGDGRDGNAYDPGDASNGASSFHGTHVAGTIAAASDNGLGIAGIAWNTKIMPLRVLGRDGGTSFDVRQAVLYAAGLPSVAPAPPTKRADIINLSLGGLGYSQAEQDAYTAAREAGVIILAAAGNQASNEPNYPAAYDGVVSVSAVSIEKTLAPYSNFGNTIDVAAPGGDTRRDVDGDGYTDGVLSTGGSDSNGIEMVYPFMQGTSMAAPHVAGVAALMKAVHPALSPDDFDNLLAAGTITEDLGESGYDRQFGHGLIDARAAVAEARRLAGGGSIPDNPRLAVNPDTLGFGAFLDSLDINLSNAGTGTLQVLTNSDNASWLTATAVDGNANGLGRYRISVNRNGLADGAYRATLSFVSTANNVNVEIIMQVGSEFKADAGRQYIQLVDAETDLVIAEQAVSASDSQYPFRFEGLAPGRYQLFSGSDFDGDGYICDSGESCGAWRTLDQPNIIELSESLQSIDFSSGYETRLNQPTMLRLSLP